MSEKDAPIASYRDREAWLEERRKGIGGSDAAAILGLNPWKSPYDVWLEKTGRMLPEKPNAAMIRGTVLEPVAADLYAEQTGRKLRRQPLRKHRDFPFILGNADRQILASGDVPETGVLEIKCPGISTMTKIKAQGLPDYMTAQLMHYMAVLGYEWGSFALFNAEHWRLIYFDIEADDRLIERLLEKEVEFWQKHVVPQVPPEVEPEPVVEMPKVEGELKVIEDPEWLKLAKDIKEARELRMAAEELEKQAKEKVRSMMDEMGLSAVEIPGFARLYYRTYKGSVSWKKTAEAMAKRAGLNLEEFLVVGQPRRSFSPFFLKGGEADV